MAFTGKSDNDKRAQRILDAALDLFTHYGYDKTTMSDIARKAHVSKGAIYLHWDSKEDLFDALLRRETLTYVDRWASLMENDPKSGTIGGMYRNAFIALRDSRLLMAVIGRDRNIINHQMMVKHPEWMEFKVTARKELFHAMQQVGAIRRDIDIDVLDYLLSMFNFGYIVIDDYIPPEEAPDMVATLEMVADMLDRFLTPPDGGDVEAGKQVIFQLVEMTRRFMLEGAVKE